MCAWKCACLLCYNIFLFPDLKKKTVALVVWLHLDLFMEIPKHIKFNLDMSVSMPNDNKAHVIRIF